jgi:hypothetical protein
MESDPSAEAEKTRASFRERIEGTAKASPAGTLQTVARHGSARWEKMNFESREGRHNLFLGIEPVHS